MDGEILARARRLAAHLPGVAVSPHYGRPWLKVGGKTLAGPCREPGALAVHCPLELKQALIEARPDLYYDTDHFRGWPAVLVRMAAIDDATLQDRLEAAWEARAPRAVRRAAGQA
ncbi:MAG: MmcQ/YjbR family DNA-binding protein [Alphaproteobacteria bacterium]|nr:MmcQ/YjbR family DNA-binding protein [Alphaproteobacteria bacterium]MBV9370775.1 MmcQ/YjbR family DNA-binding protein [Alphaproteobacteria bacterium]MBV9899848.1 MmcQ/YjbR family DNA-binding protein [Alphaproteobacteria bacterium]